MIDADALLEELNGFSMKITGNANAMELVIMGETKKSIAKMVDEQRTAYDVDKVIEKIREYYDSIAELGGNFLPEVVIKIVKSGAIE